MTTRPARARLAGPLLAFAAVLLAGAPARAGRTVRVGLYENEPKVGWGADGRPEGIFVDLLEAIAAAEGWTLEYVRGTWSEGLARLEAGELELMPDVAHSDERARSFAFHHEPVLSSWSQVYARRGSGIRSLLDLDGRRVAVLAGSTQQDLLASMVGGFGLTVELVPAPDFEAAFAGVRAGRADAVVTNRFYGLRHAADAGLEDTAVVFQPVQLHYAAPLGGDPALLAALDRHLAALKRDPGSAYYAALRRWSVGDPPPALPGWVRWAGLGALGLALVGGVWVVALRRQVAARTAELRRRHDELAALHAQREEHARELERRVAERTAELVRANEELAVAKQAAEAADHLKSAFLETMSHELRTPLNSILGFTGVVLKGLAGPLTDEQARQLAIVQQSGRHLLALINDVLDISKIEAGQLEVLAAPLDLPASLRRVVDVVTPLAAKKGLALEVDLAPDLGPATGDARRVEQVLLNLLGNAIKFTEAGRVLLEARAAADGAGVALRVVDTGVGIAPEDLPRLFRPFYQLDSTLARKHEGTGLGLAISRRLAGLMGGTLEVESAPGRGSAFTLTLPRGPARPAA